VEAMGGMVKAIEAGMPKLRIEEAAARRQAAIDRGSEVVVGVNKYRTADPVEIPLRDIDNRAVREAQIARLAEVRARRDAAACRQALDALRQAAAGEGNLLDASVAAMRARATVGEVSEALESVFGRFRATIRSAAGVYAGAYEGDEGFQRIRADVAAF